MAEWTVIHRDVYPAYISWEQYVANQQRLADNRSSFAQRARGLPRWGAALLTGVVVCGRCGRQMRAVYKPRVRYVCQALTHSYAARSCLHLDGAGIEAAVVAAFFEAMQPAELNLLDEVLAEQRDGTPRAATVAAIERELLELYRDPELVEKPVLLEQRDRGDHVVPL